MANHQYLKDLKRAGLLKNSFRPLPKRGFIKRKTLAFQKSQIRVPQGVSESENTPKISFDINSFFDKIYVLNLDHRSDRMSSMRNKLHKNGITNYCRFPAVNGHQKPHIDHWRNLKYFFDTPGAYGVLMSAYFILIDALKNKYHQILILEDDVIFHHDFTRLFNQKIKSIPDYWKLLFLGSSMHQWRLQQRCKILPDYIIPRGSIPGAFALGIKCDSYLPLITQIKKLNSSWDLGPIKYINTFFSNQCFVLNPNLVIADTTDSDIRDSKDMKTKCKHCGWKLKNYDFN